MSQDRLSIILSQVFGVSADSIKDESSPDTVASWDSMSHINMVLALESEFGISLTPEDAMEMLSVKLIRMILAEKGAPVIS